MFDVEKAIEDWRQQMLAAGIKTPTPLEELEIHLREEIEQRIKAGVSQQQAYGIATQQIGKGEMLKNEFAKVEDTKAARHYIFVQIISVVFAGFVPFWFGSMAFSNRGGFSGLTPGQRISCVAAAAMFSLLIWGGRLGYRLLPVIRGKLIREAVCLVPLAFWWIVFLNLIIPHYDFTRGQLVAIFVWGFVTPTGAFVGLIWGLETAVRKQGATTD
jgi:hypothetical protein